MAGLTLVDAGYAYPGVLLNFAPPAANMSNKLEYGAGSITGILALTGQPLIGPWQTTDREQMRMQINVRGTKAFNLNYEFSTDKGVTWYVGKQIPSAAVSSDDGANYANEAAGHFNVGYWWRISVFNLDGANSMDVAFEWRYHVY